MIFKLNKVLEDIKNKNLKKIICEFIGHDWEIYSYYSNELEHIPEKVGKCRRCGYDTHKI